MRSPIERKCNKKLSNAIKSKEIKNQTIWQADIDNWPNNFIYPDFGS